MNENAYKKLRICIVEKGKDEDTIIASWRIAEFLSMLMINRGKGVEGIKSEYRWLIQTIWEKYIGGKNGRD